ncbi:MAG: hypothetical protein KDK66_03565 [Deltaproteobacteria bacterium]|nr:hypothetical protein [Deltaproteobacteria bacterium]
MGNGIKSTAPGLEIRYRGIEELFSRLEGQPPALKGTNTKTKEYQFKAATPESYKLTSALATPQFPLRQRLNFAAGKLRADLSEFFQSPIKNAMDAFVKWKGSHNDCNQNLIEGLLDFFNARGAGRLLMEVNLEEKCREGLVGDSISYQI